jgi:hypothetical protein
MADENALREVIESIVNATSVSSGRYTFEFQVKDGGPWVPVGDVWLSWDDLVRAVTMHHRLFAHHNVKLVRL